MRFSAVIVHIDRPILKRAIECVTNADELILIKDDLENDRQECITRFNQGVRMSTGEVILVLWERMIFGRDWKPHVIAGLKKIGGSGIVNFCQTYFSSGAVTRDFIEKDLGGNLFHPDYIHYCADIEAADIARHRLKYTEDLTIGGMTAEKDKGEDLSRNVRVYDETVYRLRTNAGWPVKSIGTQEWRKEVLAEGVYK